MFNICSAQSTLIQIMTIDCSNKNFEICYVAAVDCTQNLCIMYMEGSLYILKLVFKG